MRDDRTIKPCLRTGSVRGGRVNSARERAIRGFEKLLGRRVRRRREGRAWKDDVMIETVEECAACGQPSSGNDTIHRDGFDEGPEVPLCAECGDLPRPTCEEVWAMIAARRKPLEQSDASFWRVVKERSDQLTSVDYRQFAAILARAWSSQVNANPHNDDFKSIREWLTDEAETNEQCGPEMIAACEASGEIWQLIWWSSSCGHFGFVAPSYDDLVRQVLENQAGMRRADGRDSGPMGGP